MKGLVRGFFVLAVILIIGTIAFKGVMVTKGLSSGKPMYEISVNSYDSPESYITTEYERDQETGCIKFKDEFGIKRIVCKDYTITEY